MRGAGQRRDCAGSGGGGRACARASNELSTLSVCMAVSMRTERPVEKFSSVESMASPVFASTCRPRALVGSRCNLQACELLVPLLRCVRAFRRTGRSPIERGEWVPAHQVCGRNVEQGAVCALTVGRTRRKQRGIGTDMSRISSRECFKFDTPLSGRKTDKLYWYPAACQCELESARSGYRGPARTHLHVFCQDAIQSPLPKWRVRIRHGVSSSSRQRCLGARARLDLRKDFVSQLRFERVDDAIALQVAKELLLQHLRRHLL